LEPKKPLGGYSLALPPRKNVIGEIGEYYGGENKPGAPEQIRAALAVRLPVHRRPAERQPLSPQHFLMQ
jgi:hypothetical protein